MEPEPNDAQDVHDFLLKVPLYDKDGNIVHVNKRVIRGLSEEQLAVLKLRVDDQSEKMAALRAANESTNGSSAT